MSADLIKVSKFLSYVLRHRPGDIGLTLDAEGWTSVAELIEKAQPRIQLDEQLTHQVVATNDKKRFSLSNDKQRIRANQGHSVNIDIGLTAVQPPNLLYHGTATRFLRSIQAHGLQRRKRHHVHLSIDVETATKVGERHGTPVVLEVAALTMFENGVEFFRSANGVWLTDHVPAAYLRQL